jgi:hypothetical protein
MPAVVEAIVDLGPSLSMVRNGDLYVALDHVVRRYSFQTDSGLSIEEVPVEGHIEDLIEWGSRVVAIVHRDNASPEGLEGAIFDIAPAEPKGVLTVRHVADFARGNVAAQAEARGPLLAINGGALGVILIELALPVALHLPALGR